MNENNRQNNRQDQYNNFGYHYGEGFVMSDAPEDSASSDSSASQAQNTSTWRSAAQKQNTASGQTAYSNYSDRPAYGEPTYQAGYNGSYRQTYENEDFRQNYGGKSFSGNFSQDSGNNADCEYGNYYSSDNSSDDGYSANSYYDSSKSGFGNGFNDSGFNDNFNNGAGHKKRIRRAKRPSSPISLTRRSLAFLIALCLVISAAAGFGGAALGNSLFTGSTGPDKKASASTAGYTLEDATGANMTVQEITDAAKPSVVEIKTESVTSDAWMQQYVTQGAGSGVIITNDGYIVTNNHVIDGANKITVTTADGTEYNAKLIGTDSISDVAVLKIKATDLTPATYGNSDQLAVGDLAVAIGNPLGELGGTVTAGIISALDRQLSIDGKTMTLLQTDSSINPGNSGGGLFNSDGQLIGIVVAKSSGSDVEGLGFAIPINTAADVAQQIMDKGYVSGQPSTGMTYTEGSDQSGQSGGLDSFFGGSQTSSGVYIYSVEGDNAKAAGFKSGDLVYAVDNNQITSFEDLSSIITSHKVGDKVTYTIVRDGKTMDISFKLEEKAAEQ